MSMIHNFILHGIASHIDPKTIRFCRSAQAPPLGGICTVVWPELLE